jgi:nucleoside-diphosphate-sugar epimerase
VKVLVTGGHGFVGGAVCAALDARGIARRVASRSAAVEGRSEEVVVGDICRTTDWTAALSGVTDVIHLAARVHVMRDGASDPLREFRRVNTEGTERLARASAAAGVKRLVYVSSIKANGEATGARRFSPSDRPEPQDPYGISKLEAELALARVADETGLEVVIVRPPLVYGPAVRGNFLRLLRLVRSGVPLPFGSANNLRSFVFVGNLADVLVTSTLHARAAGQTFLASDGEDLSTADLCVRLGRALGRPSRLIPVPLTVLRSAATLLRRSGEFQRLLGSLQVDSSSLRTALGWAPPFTVDQGLAATAAWFRAR